eukprot:CAMPEP_0206221940 /NCGR_PEP_ID=MMETSP0047_2-20121206/5693_1 /ASSEMBLY_ACC=CAM_ASM_000192 /TAXON_ID=195065 /ORGANISM="Chroomonas mesostigmatica_cf, Strain CCMP1168" /LENGTH=181 /DNA_ID=CAMNT_0053644729 /DNA_START=99 /DNA_END=641 /DNA_ORIENTATION=-
MSSCSQCQNFIAPGDKFCTRCGGRASQGPQCPKCHTCLDPGSRFCTTCGSATQPGAMGPPCQKCRRSLAQWEKFCTGCGHPVPGANPTTKTMDLFSDFDNNKHRANEQQTFMSSMFSEKKQSQQRPQQFPAHQHPMQGPPAAMGGMLPMMGGFPPSQGGFPPSMGMGMQQPMMGGMGGEMP